MGSILLLVHRIPYPPNKGDKIRSYHLLRMLAGQKRVFLGAFVDDQEDWAHAEAVKALCVEAKLLPLSAVAAKLRSLAALATGEPMSLLYYFRREMRNWVDSVLDSEPIEDVVIFSSVMAQYVRGRNLPKVRRIMDFVDVDSEKWRAYSAGMHFPLKWIYAREGASLLEYERLIAGEFDSCWFVSPEEMSLFKSLVPEHAAKIDYYRNGVDLDYFDPSCAHPNPYPAVGKPVVFTGAMDYRPNIDAALYFAREIFPIIKRNVPDALFYIVGSNPPDGLMAMNGRNGVFVTGRVADIRPYMKYAACAVAPLRIARGIQNKVLEAMAMARPVVASPEAAAGIDAVSGQEILIGGSADEFADIVIKILMGSASQHIGEHARRRVESSYSWSTSLRRFSDYMANTEQPGTTADGLSRGPEQCLNS